MNQAILSAAATKIRARYDSARIILFGSMALGNETPESDIDLCVIINNPSERLLDISRYLHKELHPILRRPLDLLVYDKTTFDDRASLPLTMEAEIIETGVAL
jgi:predicted nucleotidyltransferase